MYPNLYFIIEGIFGVKPPEPFSIVQTFGLFLAFCFIGAGIMLAKDMKERTALGQFKPITTIRKITGSPSISELIVNGLIGFLLGFKLLFIILNWGDFVDNPQAIVLSAKGSMTGGIIGALLMMASKYWEKQQEAKKYAGKEAIKIITQPQELVGDILIVAAISGLVGAKLFAVMEYPDRLIEDPVGQLLSGSGLAIYGGLVGGFLGVFTFIKRKGLSALHMMDAAGTPLLLGMGIGRMGCHFSGDGDWGIVNPHPKPFSALPDWLWSLRYPHNVNGEGLPIDGCAGQFYTDKYCNELPEGVYPTSVYEIIMLIGLAAIFWFILRKRIKVPGVLFFLFLIATAVERYFIEIVRINDRYDWFFNLTQAQIVSVVLVIIGTVGTVLLTRQAKKSQKTASS